MIGSCEGLTPGEVRWLCFSTAVLLLIEIATYHSLADFLGRTLLGRTEDLGPAVLAVQILRVFPVGLAFVLISVGAIVLVNQSRPQLLWLLLIGLFLCNAVLLLWSVSEDYRQLDEARRRGGAVSSTSSPNEKHRFVVVLLIGSRGSPVRFNLAGEDAA